MMHDVLADAAGDEGGKGAFAAVSHDDYVCFQFLDSSDNGWARGADLRCNGIGNALRDLFNEFPCQLPFSLAALNTSAR